MATVSPFRTYWDAVATKWAYFSAASGSTVVHNGDTLAITQDNTNPTNDVLFAAIEFDTNTAPAWVTDGPVSSPAMGLLITQMQGNAKTAGPSLVAIGAMSGSWDDTYTAAQMRALVSSYSNCGFFDEDLNGVPVCWTRSNSVSTVSFVIALNSVNPNDGGCLRLSTNPVPVLRHFYQYTIDGTTRSDATERTTYTDSILAILASRKEYRKFELVVTAKISDVRPNLDDEVIAVVKGSNIPVQSRSMNFPETWEADIPAAGSVPVSLVSNPDLDSMRGMPVETVMNLIERDGTTTAIATARQDVGDVSYGNDGMGEIELRSMLDAALNSAIVDCNPYTRTQTVNYSAERPMYILIDALLNCTGFGYKNFHYNNLVNLSKRFAGVWSDLTYTQSISTPSGQVDIRNKNVSDFISELGMMYGVCVSQSSDGCIDLWHPAEYRSSMQVWTIDEGDCLPGGYKVIKRGMDTQYGVVEITDDGGSVGATPVTEQVFLPNYIPSDPGFLERSIGFTALGQDFVDYDKAKFGLGRQLAQRLCGRLWECELQLGLLGLVVDIGDVVKLTGAGLSAVTRFLITSIESDPSSGESTAKGVHYPDALSMSSSFETIDDVHGVWRWIDETGTLDVTNMAVTATDPSASVATLASSQNWHWQGAIWQDGAVKWAVPLFTVGKHDVVEMIAVAKLSNAGNVQNYGGWADQTYVPLMVWKKATGNERMALGMVRPGLPTPSGMLNRLFFGIIDDYTATTFNFSTATILTAPAGIIGREAYSGAPTVAVAISVQFDDANNVNVYVDRQNIMSGTGYSKSGWNELQLTTQIMWDIGTVRHIQTDEAITETQRLLGMNGLDCYIP